MTSVHLSEFYWLRSQPKRAIVKLSLSYVFVALLHVLVIRGGKFIKNCIQQATSESHLIIY